MRIVRKMKTVELWSRDTDRNILSALFCFVLAATVGALLPEPAPMENIQIVQASLGVVLLILTWAGFRLLRPMRYRRNWVVVEAIGVPLLWLLTMTALGVWFAHLKSNWYMELESIGPYRYF